MNPVIQIDEIESHGVSLGLFRRLVGQRNSYAITKFARLRLKGWVVQKDPADALALLRAAARQGWGPAARLMAGIYQLGLHGIPKNAVAANYWYRKSAEADLHMRQRYNGSRSRGAKVLQFPDGYCLARLPQGHGCVLWGIPFEGVSG